MVFDEASIKHQKLFTSTILIGHGVHRTGATTATPASIASEPHEVMTVGDLDDVYWMAQCQKPKGKNIRWRPVWRWVKCGGCGRVLLSVRWFECQPELLAERNGTSRTNKAAKRWVSLDQVIGIGASGGDARFLALRQREALSVLRQPFVSQENY
jgi:hypothetical protein